MSLITLKSAIQRYRKELDAPENSYEWYRHSAQRNGLVHISMVDVSASKVGGVWYVEGTQFEKAIRAHRERRAAVAQATRDIQCGIIHGRDGSTVEIKGGFYELHGSFRLEVSILRTV